MSITLNKSEFAGFGQVATHCDINKLTQAINEAAEFDMKPLLCDLYWEVEAAWDDSGSDDDLGDLINGGTYENCNDVEVTHKGLRKMLVYYAYARYLYINQTTDTATGMVTKQRDFSLPLSEKDLSSQESRYKNMGYAIWKDIQAFICKKGSDVFPNYNFTKCPDDCACGGSCGRPGVGSKRTKFKTISRD